MVLRWTDTDCHSLRITKPILLKSRLHSFMKVLWDWALWTKNMLFSILYKLNYNYVYNEPIFLACLITKLSPIKHLMCGNYSPLLCRCAILFVIFIQFLFHAILLFTDPYRSIKILHSCQLWNVNFLIHSWLLNCNSSLNCKFLYIILLFRREI